MRPDAKTLFRGLGKFLVVVAIAAAAGAGIGVGLASLTGSGNSSTAAATASVASATTSSTRTSSTRTSPTPTSPTRTSSTPTSSTPTAARTTTTASPPRARSGPVPRVRVLSARLASSAGASADGELTARVRVTNRFDGALKQTPPALVTGTDTTALDAGARSAAGSLLGTLAPGASATGTLRFTVTAAVAQQLRTTGRARLQIAGRAVVLQVPTPPD